MKMPLLRGISDRYPMKVYTACCWCCSLLSPLFWLWPCKNTVVWRFRLSVIAKGFVFITTVFNLTFRKTLCMWMRELTGVDFLNVNKCYSVFSLYWQQPSSDLLFYFFIALNTDHTPFAWVLVGRCTGHDRVSGGRAGQQLDQQVSRAQSSRLGALVVDCGPAVDCMTLESLSH